MTTSSGSSSTPVIVSGEDDDDVPVLLRVGRKNDEGGLEFYSCIIKTKTDRYNFKAKQSKRAFSPPVFEPEPCSRKFAGCVFVGGTLYVLGGMDFKYNPCCDVFSIDTTILGAGWKKLDHSMNVPRSRPYAFTLNGKIYVMGTDESSPKPEVLDTRRMDKGWRELQDSTDVPGQIDGHAVLDCGKRIVVQCWYVPNLYCYDVEADSWQVYRQDIPGLRVPAFRNRVDWESAFLDGILYYLDKNRTGFMFGLDLSRPDHDTTKPKRVRLPLGKENWKHWGWEWIPKPPPHLWIPITHLVSLGSGKLAVVWSSCSSNGVVDVYCSTLEMSKDKRKQEEGGGGGDDFDLVARPLCLSHVVVHGTHLEGCKAVFPSQTMGLQEEEVKKEDNTISAHEDVDDSTISANHKNSTGGTNNKKNCRKKNKNSEKNKNMQEKGRMRGSGHGLSKSTGNVGTRIACGIVGVQE